MSEKRIHSEISLENLFSKMSDEEVGKLVKEYLVESNHSSWEGFRSSDKTGIRRLFTDMILYYGTGEV